MIKWMSLHLMQYDPVYLITKGGGGIKYGGAVLRAIFCLVCSISLTNKKC